jgi:hypothetical protein
MNNEITRIGNVIMPVRNLYLAEYIEDFCREALHDMLGWNKVY